MGRLGRWIAARPAPALGLAAALVLAGASYALQLGVDPGNEALFLADDPARAALETLKRRFASDLTVVVALRGPILTAGGLERVEELRARLAGLPPVRLAVGLTNVRNIYRTALGAYGWPPYEWVKDGDKTVEEFAAEVLAEPLFAGNLISRDGRMAAIVVELRAKDRAAVDALRAAARASEGGGFEAFVAGHPIERVEFADTIRRDQQLFVPLVALTLAALMALLFRQLWGVALPLAIVGASVATTTGLFAAAGKEVNAVSSMLTPVVMIVSVAVSVNFLMAYAQEKAALGPGAPRIEAAAAAIGRVGLPCLFTTATTVAGFGSLAASDVPAIADFGTFSAVGVALSYGLALLILPPLLALERPAWGPGSLHVRPGAIESLLAHAAPLIERRRRIILAAAAVAVAVAVAGAARIRVETDILGQLPTDGELLRATRAIDESLSGVNAIEVVRTGPPRAFRTAANLRALADLQDWLAAQDGVAKVFSAVDILRRLHEVRSPDARRALPEGQPAIDEYFGLLDQAKKTGDPLEAFLTPEADCARLTARLRSLPSSRNIALLSALEVKSRELFPAGIEARATGEFVLLQNMTARLPYAMLEGLAWATAFIVGSIGLLFRSVRLAALAAIPASIPILFVYGLMGWVGIWLSVPTSMISSVVLGLAVDSTILFLSRYRQERAAGHPRRESVYLMLENAGQSVTYSNLTLIFGFAVAALSRFPPVRDFGLLTSLTIAASYLGALALLPALIFAARPGSISMQKS